MERMPSGSTPGEKLMGSIESGKQKGVRMAMDNMWLIVTFLALAVIVTVMTTDISMESVADLTAIGQEFFVLLFCAYIVYLSWGGHGAKQGAATKVYTEACNRYNEIRGRIVDESLQVHLADFCRDQIEAELKATRLNIICSSGLDYKIYETFIGKSEDEIRNSDIKLSEAQVKAILRANKVKPIRFTPEMLLQKDKRSFSRSFICVDPVTVQRVSNLWRLVSSAAITFLVTITAFDASASVDWSVIGEALFKLATVLYGGFCGYQSNYENMTVRAVRFINAQSDYLEQFYNSRKKNG